MKRIFPIISILILLSLLGLIFFQWLWIESARDIKEQQINDKITLATADAAEKLMVERPVLPPKRNNDILFPKGRMTIELFGQSVLQRFSKQEIADIIRGSLRFQFQKDIPFEFAVGQNNLTGEESQSANFID